MITSKAGKHSRLIHSICINRYNRSVVGSLLLGTAASRIPQADMIGVATLEHMAVVYLLVNIGKQIVANSVVDSLPGQDAIGNIVIQNAADTVMIINESTKMSPLVYTSCDKGNKKGNKNLNTYMC